MQRQLFAYDHVEPVTTIEGSGVLSLYIARGRPDKWHPWTKSDHRRVIKPGCWAAPVPADGSMEAFWAARRHLALVEQVDDDDLSTSRHLPSISH